MAKSPVKKPAAKSKGRKPKASSSKAAPPIASKPKGVKKAKPAKKPAVAARAVKPAVRSKAVVKAKSAVKPPVVAKVKGRVKRETKPAASVKVPKPPARLAARGRFNVPVVVKSKPTPPPVVQHKPEPAVVAKPKKNGSGLTTRDLAFYTQVLLKKRREIVGDMTGMELEALRSGSGGLSSLPVHMADMGTDNFEQEFTLQLVEKDRVLLREINHALSKIVAGTYGICEGTGEAIGKARLEFQPWAKYSIDFARRREKMGMGVRPF